MTGSHKHFIFFRYKVKNVVFVPYALKDYDSYTNTVKSTFKKFNLKYGVYGIHERQDPFQAVKEADAIFVGGGNTFLLLKTLYDNNLIDFIRDRVIKVKFLIDFCGCLTILFIY